jgi:hypothetical protein
MDGYDVHAPVGTRGTVVPGLESPGDVSLEALDGYDWILSAGFPGSFETPATCSNARSNIGGSSLPLLAARRRIPAQAVELKKNLFGADGSSTCHNEHTAASLGHSKPLSVEDSPGQGSSWTGNDTTHWPTWNVLP